MFTLAGKGGFGASRIWVKRALFMLFVFAFPLLVLTCAQGGGVPLEQGAGQTGGTIADTDGSAATGGSAAAGGAAAGGTGGAGGDAAEENKCGNGVIDEDEECDGTNLGGATCGSLGEGRGSLVCDRETCKYDTEMCEPNPDPVGYGA